MTRSKEATAATNEDAKRQTGLQLFETMLRIRELETKIESLHHSGRMQGSFHSSMGQEGSAVGVCSVLRPDDVVTSTHRGHGHAVAKGMPLELIFAELFGFVTGSSQGRGGSMHLHDVERGFLGENAIVAGGLPWAAGAAWAARRQGRDIVGVGFAGDGAAAHGVFAETLRMARTWTTPFLLVCENNHLAHSMPVDRTFGEPGSIARWASGFGVETAFVSGDEVLAVRDTAEGLVDHVRSSGTPAVLEVEVWRVRAHSLNDPDYRYLPKGLGASHLETHDPVERLAASLPVSEDEQAAIIERVNAEIEDAVERASAGQAGGVDVARSRVYSANFEAEARRRGW